MTSPDVADVKPIEVVIEAVQYTPDRKHGRVQFRALGESGLLARSSEYHPTQDDWAALAPADLRALAPDYWSCAEVKEHLRLYLASQGVYAVIVANTDTPVPSPDPEDQKPNKSQAKAAAAENTGA